MSSSQGYGYSIWYIPEDYQTFANEYDITHIPHLTYETNLSYDQIDILFTPLKQRYPSILVKAITDVEYFPSMYQNDPLSSYGWYMEVINPKSFYIFHTPHMSLKYWGRKDVIQSLPLPTNIKNQKTLFYVILPLQILIPLILDFGT